MSHFFWLILGLTVAYTIWLFPHLPDQIPIHFGADGTPDAWGSRASLILPVAELAWAMRFIEGV